MNTAMHSTPIENRIEYMPKFFEMAQDEAIRNHVHNILNTYSLGLFLLVTIQTIWQRIRMGLHNGL